MIVLGVLQAAATAGMLSFQPAPPRPASLDTIPAAAVPQTVFPHLENPPGSVDTLRKRRKAAETLSIRALDAFDTFFTDLYDACEAMDIPADTSTSETGLGQFEVNLMHCDDALRAADDAWLFKMLVKGLARRHGFAASFMAKPYPEYSGSDLHTHFSLIDSDGRNVFDSGGPKGTAIMRNAVDFPQPEGPSIEKNSPSRMVKSASSTATKSVKTFETWSISMTGLASEPGAPPSGSVAGMDAAVSAGVMGTSWWSGTPAGTAAWRTA